MEKKEFVEKMPVKEGDQSVAPKNKGAKPGQGEVVASPKELDGKQSMKPDHVKKALPSEGPFELPKDHPQYDPKKSTL